MTDAEPGKQRGPPPEPSLPDNGESTRRGGPGGRGGGSDKKRSPTRDRKPGDERKS
jgi:hypothetical protein